MRIRSGRWNPSAARDLPALRQLIFREGLILKTDAADKAKMAVEQTNCFGLRHGSVRADNKGLGRRSICWPISSNSRAEWIRAGALKANEKQVGRIQTAPH